MNWTLSFAHFEFKPQDAWIGAYWKRTRLTDQAPDATIDVLDVWICVLPMVPLHLQFMGGWVRF